ncbi:DUF2752 domain-containing protein [Brachyspira sp.]|uniref:DUF2752 domain-containing protein n=1 Tax=Brachyspira sp. TaxID=1977261 RepID=UPI00260F128E|nr:DUF2752 domain-containing protein [Brachyspira sp.]
MIKILKLVFVSFIILFINYDSNKYADEYYINIDELCLIKNITGFPCPSCGMTRAYIEVFKLNFNKAFHYHPLFIFPSIIFFITIFRDKLKIANYIYNNYYIIISVLLIFILVYFIRFILLFPNQEPFTYNYNSKFYTVLKALIYVFK